MQPEKRNSLFRHSRKKDTESKVSVAESELLRILKHLEGKSLTDKDVDSIVSLKVGKNVKKYDELIRRNGLLKLAVHECKYEMEYKESDKSVKPVKNGKVTHRYDKNVSTYKSMLTGAGHSRNCKSLYVRTDVVHKMNQILLCGIPWKLKYAKPAKWNSYYAMCSTDSEPVKELPNIIVIDDYEKLIDEYVDEVEEEYLNNGNKKYRVNNNVRRKVPIKPFDGAGVVTPQCVIRWSLELGIRNSDGKRYIPAAFQFRAIPGIKGELFVIDIYKFMDVMDVRYVKDIWGKTWDLRRDKIDCILTKSQFKFYDLYKSYDHWKTEFQKELYGYKRTFNISSYAEDPTDLKRVTMLSYQPLQTLKFTLEEIKRLTKYGIELVRTISTDIDEFIRYRGMLQEDEDTEHSRMRIPDFYNALRKCPQLFNDKYIYGKIEDDIKKLKNNLYSGKVIVEGNYQTLTPDIYALLQYAFGLPVNGLLRKGQIYSAYWSGRNVKLVDIIRNPHINMEHRLGYIRQSEKMDDWYEFQTTGIITSMYDTYLLALGGADTDGDHVCCTPNTDIINAVMREIIAEHGRTVIFKPYKGKDKDRSVCINDTVALMQVNKDSFANDIGSVINEISKLWSIVYLEDGCETEELRDYIKICSCIGGLVIDFAKTGEKAEIPIEIKEMLVGIKKPYFMRYLPQNLDIAAQEEKAIKKAYIIYGISPENLRKLYRFEEIGNGNMDSICKYVELELNDIVNLNIQTKKEFDFHILLHDTPPVNRQVKKTLYNLQDIYSLIGQEKSMDRGTGKELDREYSSRYRYFFSYCQSELLSLNIDVNDLIDMLVIIYYTDTKFVDNAKQKDILWNTFGEELVKRCDNDYELDTAKIELLKERKNENYRLCKNKVLKKINKKRVSIITLDKYFDNVVTITKGDRQMVNDFIKLNPYIKAINKIDACRLYMVLLMIARKTGNTKITKYYNKPSDITNLTISKLAGIDRRKIDNLLAWFGNQNLLQVEQKSNCNVEINIEMFGEFAGDIWIQSDNYNQICTEIRDYFRK